MLVTSLPCEFHRAIGRPLSLGQYRAPSKMNLPKSASSSHHKSESIDVSGSYCVLYLHVSRQIEISTAESSLQGERRTGEDQVFIETKKEGQYNSDCCCHR